MSTQSNTSSGIGILGLLGVAFVVLKIIGKITWSWWWVTSPFWGPVALALAAFAFAGLCAGMLKLIRG